MPSRSFLVLKTLWYVDEFDAVEAGEINMVVGSNFVISVRHGEGNALHQARRDLEGMEAVLQHGPSAVIYAVCDQGADRYEAVGGRRAEDGAAAAREMASMLNRLQRFHLARYEASKQGKRI